MLMIRIPAFTVRPSGHCENLAQRAPSQTCDRPIPPSQRDARHLVPKSRGGVQKTWLHRICHRQIHALLTETELAREYHHVQALREHPELAKFLDWVRRKPDDFFERTRKSQRLRSR